MTGENKEKGYYQDIIIMKPIAAPYLHLFPILENAAGEKFS